MANCIKLEPNVPVTLTLLDPYADSCELYDQERGVGEYRTIDGRILALPRQAAIELNALNPQPGEEIGICRYTGKQARIAVWLSSASERQRAEAETALESSADPSDTELLLAASLKRENGRKRRNGHPVPIRKEPETETAQPRLFDRGTGTNGPAMQPAAIAIPLPAQAKRPPDVIPWNVAFREVAKFVSTELVTCNLQWSDEAQQAAVCTVLIAEVKKGRIGLWER